MYFEVTRVHAENTPKGEKPFGCSQSNTPHKAILRDMKEPTTVINHSVAPSVTTNVQYQTI